MKWQLLYCTHTHTHTHTHARTHTQCSTTVFFLLAVPEVLKRMQFSGTFWKGTQLSITGTINSNGITNRQQPVTWLLVLLITNLHLAVAKTQPQLLPLCARQSVSATSPTRPACVANKLNTFWVRMFLLFLVKQLPTQMHSGELNSKPERYLFCISNARTTK